ncbi:hypothetical protein HDV01_003927 [Terramyces sp. JEL0728]|nr:hypothetical protein HDV01_003927 [Terramyces sp. JEL0728]
MVVSAYYSRMPTIRCQDCNAVVEWANEHTHVCGQDENPMPSHKFHRPPSSVYGMNQLNDGMKDMKVSRFEERSASKKKADPIQAFQQFKNKKSFDDSHDDFNRYDDYQPTPFEEPKKRYDDRNGRYENDQNYDRKEKSYQDEYSDRYQDRDDRYQERKDRHQPEPMRNDDRYQPEPMRNNSFREKDRNDRFPSPMDLQRKDSYRNNLERNDSFKDDFQHDYSQPYFEQRKQASPVDEYDLNCGDCKQPIYDTGDAFEIEVLNKCNICKHRIRGPHVEHNGKAFCAEDYERLTQSNCARCQQPIDGNSVHACGGVYHRDCFGCTTCYTPFPDKKFFVYEGQPYCLVHYHEASNTLCGTCRNPIQGQCVDIRETNKRYHPDCWTCAVCRMRLTGVYFSFNGKQYCEADIDRVYKQGNGRHKPSKRNTYLRE